MQHERIQHLDLFSGIGGFAIAAEKVWPNIEHTFCEIDPFCQAVLKKHWPDAKIHEDIRTLTYSRQLHGQQSEGEGIQRPDSTCGKARTSDKSQIDLLTGGFPCQPFSSAGRRKGKEDDRHLWPEMLRIIRETNPTWVIGENVRGLLTWNGGLVLDEVFADLEGLGYEVGAFVIPAVAVNAPHRRDRVWVVAHAIGSDAGGAPGTIQGEEGKERLRERDDVAKSGQSGKTRDASNPKNFGLGGRGSEKRRTRQDRLMVSGEQGRDEIRRQDEGRDWSDWPPVATRLCALDDGLSGGLVRPVGWRNAALKAAGNAIVPRVAEQIMRAIKEA